MTDAPQTRGSEMTEQGLYRLCLVPIDAPMDEINKGLPAIAIWAAKDAPPAVIQRAAQLLADKLAERVEKAGE